VDGGGFDVECIAEGLEIAVVEIWVEVRDEHGGALSGHLIRITNRQLSCGCTVAGEFIDCWADLEASILVVALEDCPVEDKRILCIFFHEKFNKALASILSIAPMDDLDTASLETCTAEDCLDGLNTVVES